MVDEDKDLESPKKKKGGILKLIIIVFVVLILVGGGVFAYLTFFAGSSQEQVQDVISDDPMAPVQPQGANSENGITYDFPAFIVNLADPSGSKYLRVALSVEIPPKNEKMLLEIEQKLPKIKDAIITVLSSKTFEEIITPQGKISLKQEILRRINSNLASGRLMGVYITEFVVQ